MTKKLLPVPDTDFVPASVVDHTTELLKEPRRKSREETKTLVEPASNEDIRPPHVL